MSSEFSSLAEFVRARMAELSLSQAEIAARSGLTASDVNGIVQGRIKLPGPEKRRALAKALGVSHVDLFVAAGEITREELRNAGAEGVVEEDPDPLRAQLIGVVRQVRWDEKPELAHSLITVAMGILKDQQTATARRPASSAQGR